MGTTQSRVHEAANIGALPTFHKILMEGGDLDQLDYYRRTPLSVAIISQNFKVPQHRPDVVKYLVNHGANVNNKDSCGWSPLHYACLLGDPEIVRILIDKGAQPNVHNMYGMTPLDFLEIKFSHISGKGEGVQDSPPETGSPFEICKNMLLQCTNSDDMMGTQLTVLSSKMSNGEYVHVKYRTLKDHSTYDYIQLYYLYPDRPFQLHPTIGFFKYLPPGDTGVVVFKGTPPGTYRALYVRDKKVVSASKAFVVIDPPTAVNPFTPTSELARLLQNNTTPTRENVTEISASLPTHPPPEINAMGTAQASDMFLEMMNAISLPDFQPTTSVIIQPQHQ